MLRQPTTWERYRWHVIATAVFCLLQAGLIVDLMVNRSKRRQGEAEAVMLAEISSRFVNLPPGDVDRAIVDAQRRICQHLDLDLSVLWQVQEGSEDFVATHVHQPEESRTPPQPFRQQDFPWVRREMIAGRTVLLTRISELPPEATKDRETVSRFGIKSTLTIPLSVGGEQTIGVLSFNTLRQERPWPEPLIRRLQLVAQIFASALARKRTDHALRESAERLSLAINSAGAGPWVLDCRTLEIWASAEARTLLGYSRDESIDLSRFEESVHPEDWALVQQGLNRAMQAGEPINVEYRVRRSDRREQWIASRGRLFPGSDGKPERLLGLSIDITERKRIEHALLAQRAELAHLSRVAMLGELSGSMAHELNQPLTAILSNAQAAQRYLAAANPDLSEVRDILADIVAEDKRAGEIIHRLRLLLKKEAAQHQPLDVNEIVHDVLKLVRSDLVNHDIAAETLLAPALPRVLGDRVQLQQVLLNLVMNGCEAMADIEKGARQLTIRTDRAGDGSIRVSVTDRGPGMAPENLGQIFESFYTTKPQGLGLGLTVCRTIIEAHRGTMWANSIQGHGATVGWTLPPTEL